MGPLRVLRATLVAALLFASVSAWQCHKPKVRKEWRCLSPDERHAWLTAVECLASLPHDPKIVATTDPSLSVIPPINQSSSHYDDFVYIHMDLNVWIHNTGFFLPWHRLYVQTFEDELRSKCGFDGVQPYWDWTKDTADFYDATIWSDDDYDGLGSWGDPNNDFQIYTGGLKDIQLSYPVPHNIRRNFSLYPEFPPGFPVPAGVPPINPALMLNTTFTSAVVNQTVNTNGGDYISFQTVIENFGGPHPGPHFILGGDMGGTCPFGGSPPSCWPGPKWTSNDPIFFLHHAMIDKVWTEWQYANSSNTDAFAGGTVSFQANSSVFFLQYPTGAPPWLNTSSAIPSDGMWDYTTVEDVLSTVGGRLCYVYE